MRVALLALLALLPLCLAQEGGLSSGSLGALLAASSEVPYDPALAKLLVHYSAASYCSNRSALASWTCPRCSPPSSNAPPLRHVQVLWNASSQVQGYVAYEAASNLTVIAFRGSVGTLNWLEDFDVSLVPRPDACAECQVSKGFFLDTYQTIAQDVRDALAAVRAAVGGPSPVLVTGHSLGAALAELLAYDLATAAAAGGPPVQLAAVLTFGKPRVGNAAWAAAWTAVLQSATPVAYRVVHYEDPVPHLPLELMDYAHPPTEVCVLRWRAQGPPLCPSKPHLPPPLTPTRAAFITARAQRGMCSAATPMARTQRAATASCPLPQTTTTSTWTSQSTTATRRPPSLCPLHYIVYISHTLAHPQN